MNSLPEQVDRATDYAKAVVSGELPMGRLVRMACERHLRDLEDGHARGIYFDADAAARAIRFFETILCLNGGEFEGKPFLLRVDQSFIVGSIFGWKRQNGKRRFRTAYIEEAKGTGKSPLAAGVGHYCFCADGEPRAEVYAAATKLDQAKILFRDAVAMAYGSPTLKKRLHLTGAMDREWHIAYHETHSSFKCLASDDKTQSGFRPHCALVDEIHEHKTPSMIDMLKKNLKNRSQPLIFEITNSGFDRKSVCWDHHKYTIKILEGHIADDWFGFICALDPCDKCWGENLRQPKDGCKDCDDWRDESCWHKANPNLLIDESQPAQVKAKELQLNYLRGEVHEAMGMPARENSTKRLNFCLWTDSVTSAIPMQKWDACGRDVRNIEDYYGRICFGGLDGANRLDVAAFVLAFPEIDGGLTVFPFFWVPEMGAQHRSHVDRVDYLKWINDGLMKATPGDAIDHEQIRNDIRELGEQFEIREIGFDRHDVTQLVTQLMGDGFKMKSFGQGYYSMNAPTKEVLSLVAKGELYHSGNEVLRWMASNLCTEQDPAGSIKMSKAKSTEKIDGMVALAMAVGMAIGGNQEASVYESRGVLTTGDE